MARLSRGKALRSASVGAGPAEPGGTAPSASHLFAGSGPVRAFRQGGRRRNRACNIRGAGGIGETLIRWRLPGVRTAQTLWAWAPIGRHRAAALTGGVGVCW